MLSRLISNDYGSVATPTDDESLSHLIASPTAAAPSGASYTATQAQQDVQTLYQAARGGLFGWGTDEETLWRIFEHRTAAHIQDIRERFNTRYRTQDFDQVLRSEVQGRDRTHLDTLLKGGKAYSDGIVRNAQADAIAMRDELDSLFRIDRQKLLNLLGDAPADYRREVSAAYANAYRNSPAGGKHKASKALKTSFCRNTAAKAFAKRT